MIASLPMYDRPETSAATDRLWALIRDGLRARGVAAPDGLTRGSPDLMADWEADDLVLSQTCGMPYRTRLHGRVTLVGTPDYGVEGCPPGHYRSVIVARADDPRTGLQAFDGATLAYNDTMSQSGWSAPQTAAAARGIRLGPGPQTGAHRQSVVAVAEGRAEIAAIDAVTFALLQAHDPVAARVRIVDRTPPTPGLPLIAARSADPGAAFAAVADAIAALSPDDARTLRLRGLVRIPAEAYLAVPTPAAIDRNERGL